MWDAKNHSYRNVFYDKVKMWGYAFALFGLLFVHILNLDGFSLEYNWLDGQMYQIEQTYRIQETFFTYYLIGIIIISIILDILKIKLKIQHFAFYIPFFLSLIGISVLFFNPSLFLMTKPNPIQGSGSLFKLAISGYIVLGSASFILFLSLKELIYPVVFRTDAPKIIYIALAVILTSFIHELGHAVFVLLAGGEIIYFISFPVYINGVWILGEVRFTNITQEFVPLALLGGVIFSNLFIPIFYLGLRKIHNIQLKNIMKFGLIVLWLDFPFYTLNNLMGIPQWFLAGSTNGDILNSQALSGVPLWIFIVLAIGEIFIGGMLIARWNSHKQKIQKKSQRLIRFKEGGKKLTLINEFKEGLKKLTLFEMLFRSPVNKELNSKFQILRD